MSKRAATLASIGACATGASLAFTSIRGALPSTPVASMEALSPQQERHLRGGNNAGAASGDSLQLGSLACVLALVSIGAAQGSKTSRAARPASTKVAVSAFAGGRSCHGGSHLSAEAKAELESVAKKIATPGKGITACDESAGTIGIRFEAVGVENTEEHRRIYRQMLFKTPEVENYLSAAILDPETMFQNDDEGVPFPKALSDRGIIPGVKPHLKVYELPGRGGETVMQGLDSLAVRCKEYKEAGAQFAKWRSPLQITANGPSDLAIESNMQDLARYALICQDEGLVPIVEPDVVMKGDHDLETAIAVNTKVQSVLYRAMLEHGVFMEGSILKTNMVNPGLSCPTSYTVQDIAEANITTLRRVMPMAIPGCNFLSGGQSLEDAAARLNAINEAKGNGPWNLSFSWSAALQFPLFDLCKGKDGALPIEEMGKLYVEELKIAAAASKGEHTPKDGEGSHKPA